METQLSLDLNRKLLFRYTLTAALTWTLVLIGLALLARHQEHMKNIFGLYFGLWLAGILLMWLSFLYSKKQLLKSEASVVGVATLRQHYENILSAAGEGILGLDRNYLHDFVNPAAAKMLGYTKAELIGQPSHQTWHSFEAEASPYPLKNCPVCKAMLDGKAVKNFRDQFSRKDGSLFPVEVSISPIIEDGTVQGAVVVFKDISERVADEALRRRLSSIVEQAHSAVAVVGLDGIIEYVNHGYEVISGFTIAEMLGRHPQDLFFTEEREAERRELWQSISQGRNWRGILASRRKDGTVGYEDTTGFPLFDERGRIINYAVIKYDVSQAQKLQEQLFQAQKMEAVGTLASGVAHDFNNILTVINSFSETLINECAEDSEIRPDLVEINEAGHRAADLTRQLLAFSRRQMILPKELCLRKLLANLMKMMQRLLGEDIDLQLDLPGPEKRVRVKADAGQFEQVIINLLVNARDALKQKVETGPKEIVLRLAEVDIDDTFVSDHVGSRAGRQALIEIRDSGCGMSQEALKHCFEPFYTTKELGQGTGLGLSTVYGIVKQNSAYITISSEPGLGSTIKIYWPLVPEDEVLTEAEVEMPKVDIARFKGATIMVVEDDAKIREVAESRLRKAGFQVIVAGDGQEALVKLASAAKPPDLLFTDIVMPVMGGRELSRHLQERYPGLPVLFASGYTDSGLIRNLAKNESFLQKPYTINSLLVAMGRLLEGRADVDKQQ